MTTFQPIRENILAGSPYVVHDMPPDFVKLDAMECPFPLDSYPAHVLHDLQQSLMSAAIHRYPNPATCTLQEPLRRFSAIPEAAALVLGNGSDEIIEKLTLLVAKPGATALSVAPSFVMYRKNAELFGLNFAEVVLEHDFSLDIEKFCHAIKTLRPALTFLALPNNPTGRLFETRDIERIIDTAAPGLVVVDEAYGAFSDVTFMQRAGSVKHLIVLKTLSKIGFAGLRLGYAAMAPEIAHELHKIMPPYNLNALSIAAATCLIGRHESLIKQNVAMLKAERDRMLHALQNITDVNVTPSAANFVTVQVQGVESLFNTLYSNKILVKNLAGSHVLLEHALRLTIGLPAHNSRVLDIIRSHVQNQAETPRLNTL